MEKEFDIDRGKACIYLIVGTLIPTMMMVVFIFAIAVNAAGFPISPGIVLMLGILVAVLFCFWSTLAVNTFRYCLVENTLKIDQGIIFRSRKSIPLEKITDLELVQGPLLMILGMWVLQVQTAGTGTEEPEATLIGCVDPEQVRADVLAAKDEYLKQR